MLHAVLQRIAELDAGTARSFLGRWRHSDIAVYRRLWAAAARNVDAVSAAEVAEFLTALDDSDFWNFASFPEFAEMRALRFSGLRTRNTSADPQAFAQGDCRAGFSREIWEAEESRTKRRVFAAMELRRIEIGGGTLPARDRDWLLEATDEFPGLKNLAIDGGFRDPWVRPYFPPSIAPRSRFDDLEGEARLRALEDALSSKTSDDQAYGLASDTPITLSISCAILKAQLRWRTASRTSGIDSGICISQPGSQPESETPRNARSEAALVLSLMNRLSDTTVEAAIDGICTGSTCGPSMLSGASSGGRFGCAHGRSLSRSRMRPKRENTRVSQMQPFAQVGKTERLRKSMRFACL